MKKTIGATAIALSLALAAAAFVPTAANAASSAEISGTVHSDSGSVVKGLTVQAVIGSKVIKSATTNSSGSFTVKGLPRGTYTLKYSDAKKRYLTEYFGDAATVETATPIVLDTGEKRTRTSESVTPAGKISGSVYVDGTGADPRLGVIEARLINESGNVVQRQVASPDFSFGLLPTGTYTVFLCTPNDDQSHVTCAYYRDGDAEGPWTPLYIATGASQTGLDTSLSTVDAAVQPSRIAATVPSKVTYGKKFTVSVKVPTYGDSSTGTVSLKHHGKIVETTNIVKGKATFTLSSSKSWKKTKEAKTLIFYFNGSATAAKSSVVAKFHIKK